MKGVIQEYQETQRTAEGVRRNKPFFQDFKADYGGNKGVKMDTEWAELTYQNT